MTTIKIESNPYDREIKFLMYNVQDDSWVDIKKDSINSKLREEDETKLFLPFKISDIIKTIIDEYYVGKDKIKIIFEGTSDEFRELNNYCSEDSINNKVVVEKSDRILRDGRDIISQVKENFLRVEPLIRDIAIDSHSIIRNLDKVSDALKDIIPICIFGNYSAGKSTFINALIGYEILPSGGDPVTAKIFEINRSKQSDRGHVQFCYKGEDYDLLFNESECTVLKGDKKSELISEINEKISQIDSINLFRMVNVTIDILNSYEKKDKTTTVIGNIIKIEVPFSENGKLGKSRNDFVIFDTPGSNSNSNEDHEKVLKDALQDFSNGIPVWVTQYDAIDSTDNANLCSLLNGIDALDKRFTMIMVNKADSVDLPKAGFKKEDVTKILDYDSVNNMYSSGIYFVSSVMGIGAKNYDGIISEYIQDVFEEKEKKFSDPSSRNYKKLYEYNIMPEQKKRHALKYSEECDNLIYANSGLYCVEMEMEEFASKYAEYNKCQMVFIFLKSIVEETEKRIEENNKYLEKQKWQAEKDLDNKKMSLLENIRKTSFELTSRYESESKRTMRSFVRDSCNYEYSLDRIDKSEQKLTEENSEDINLALYVSKVNYAKETRKRNLIENAKNLTSGKITESLKKLFDDWKEDSTDVKEKTNSVNEKKRNVDKVTSDELMNQIKKMYKENSIEAQSKISLNARSYWHTCAEEFRDKMNKIVTESVVLSSQQRNEMSDVILNYEPLQFDDESEAIFIKAKFLKSTFFGRNFGFSEKLNKGLLVSNYNSKVKKNITEMSKVINESCFESFKMWQNNLENVIRDNLAIYNPEMRFYTQVINEHTMRITKLKNDQWNIRDSIENIESMMSWKMNE